MSRCLLFAFLICLAYGCSSYAHEIQKHREAYKAEFTSDQRSPLSEDDLKYLDFFPPNAKAKVNASFVMTADAESFELPTYSGITRTYRQWGVATFLWGKDSVQLSIYENMTLRTNPVFKDYLFLPFKDETNGLTTYGGGRYLNVSKADTEDGLMTIDFNLTYNPWCAYSDGFNCPIPPKENDLQFAIEAGEKDYKGVHKTEASQ